MNVSELITTAEGKTLEFKRDLSSLPPVLKTPVAFANTAGGTLVIGIQDDGAVVGIADALGEEERLASSIAGGIRPAMTPEMDLVSHEGKTLLIVRVLRELGLVEEWGTGYRRVTQACGEGGYPPPHVAGTELGVTGDL